MAKHAMKHAAWHVASGDQQLLDFMVAHQTGQQVYLMEAVKTQIHLFWLHLFPHQIVIPLMCYIREPDFSIRQFFD